MEAEEKAVLIDPGVFSWKSGLFKIDEIERIDQVLITHEHADHMHPDFLRTILEKFPTVEIVTTESAQRLLKEEGIYAQSAAVDHVVIANAPHEKLEPFGVTPEHASFHVQDRLTHAGDSHQLRESKEILAIAMTAPWGSLVSMVDAVLALESHPKYVIPIHDWHYSDDGRRWAYKALAPFLQEHNIEFVPIENGIPIQF